jgi:hypothetical protein
MLTPPRNEVNCFYLYDWNYAVGCTHVSRGCKNCALQGLAGTYRQFATKGVTTRTKDGRHVFNGNVWIAPTDDPLWLDPLLPGTARPTADPGKPSLVIVNVTSDPFHEAIPEPVSVALPLPLSLDLPFGLRCFVIAVTPPHRSALSALPAYVAKASRPLPPTRTMRDAPRRCPCRRDNGRRALT